MQNHVFSASALKKVISPEEVWGLAFLICCFIHLQDESLKNKDLETHHPKVQIPHYKVDEWKILLVDEKANDIGWYITASSEVSSTAISCGHSSLSTLQEKVPTMIVLCVTVFGMEAYNNRIVIDLVSFVHLWHNCDRNIIYPEIMIYWWYEYHISRNYDRLVINYLTIKNERLIFMLTLIAQVWLNF